MVQTRSKTKIEKATTLVAALKLKCADLSGCEQQAKLILEANRHDETKKTRMEKLAEVQKELATFD